MRSFNVFALLMTGLLAGAVAGCNSTQLATSWKDPETAGPVAFEKVVVLVLNSSPGERRAQEDELVRQIKRTAAVPSYTLVSEGELADREAVKEKIRQAGFDGAVVLRLLDTQQGAMYVPGSSSYWTDRTGYTPYGHPGYNVTYTDVRAEVGLYRVADGKLLWSGSSTTTNPSSAQDLAMQVAQAAAVELRKQGLLR